MVGATAIVGGRKIFEIVVVVPLAKLIVNSIVVDIFPCVSSAKIPNVLVPAGTAVRSFQKSDLLPASTVAITEPSLRIVTKAFGYASPSNVTFGGKGELEAPPSTVAVIVISCLALH